MPNPTLQQKVPFTLTPRTSADVSVNLTEFPTALTDIVWSSSEDSKITPAAGGLSAELVAMKEGPVTVTVKAKNVKGVELTGSARVVFGEEAPPVPVVPEVSALHLTQQNPVAA